ncbi:receptor-like protein kinase FERONIA [Corylus avellana]|uniref:receptor-like protein kinase FERONIA n=1 Tax=Corylus avellana TaxID=13451 RepID=UPI00286A7DE5|nr:receptor-like protein kinase FERONIA [Corylus avellana]
MSKTHVSTVVKGSMGYMDPEYYRLQQLTEKFDVYSFGVMLCARPPLLCTVGKNQVSLAHWAPECYHNKMFDQIVDPFLKGVITLECLKKFGEIVVNCLLDDGTERPSMNEVVWGLELALQMQESTNYISFHGEMNGPLFQELAKGDSDNMFTFSSEGALNAKSTGPSMIENFANKDSDCLLPKTVYSLNAWLQEDDERI